MALSEQFYCDSCSEKVTPGWSLDHTGLGIPSLLVWNEEMVSGLPVQAHSLGCIGTNCQPTACLS
jgi:hypothetical protein